jgi:hypothetical protein
MNTAHLHKNPETGAEEEAFGLREHCNVCRKAAGKDELSETDLKLLKSAAKTSAGSSAEPVEQLLADLKEQEEVNDQLRAQIKEKDAEIALLRKDNEQLKKKRSE